MRTYQHEEELRSLGVDPERPQPLLAFPVVAALLADDTAPKDEVGATLSFCRDGLGLEENEVSVVQRWFAAPLSAKDIDRGITVLVDLRDASDVLAIENNLLTRALGEADAALSRRPEAAPSAKGQQLVSDMKARLGLDPGTPWTEMAPEQFQEQPKSSSKGEPIRRHLTNRRLDRDDLERGGIV